MNLPDEFRDYERIAFQRKKKYVKRSIVFGGQTVKDLLTALSDARDEIERLSELFDNAQEVSLSLCADKENLSADKKILLGELEDYKTLIRHHKEHHKNDTLKAGKE